MAISASPVTTGIATFSGNPATASITLSGTPADGSLVVCLISGASAGRTVSGIVQTGASFSQVSASGVNRASFVWYAENVTSAGTGITITMNTTNVGAAWCGSWTGIKTSSSLDASNVTNSGTSTTPNVTITPTAGLEELLVVTCRGGGAKSAGYDSSFTDLTDADTRTFSAFRVVSSTSGSYTPTVTTGSGTWDATGGSFKGIPASGSISQVGAFLVGF